VTPVFLLSALAWVGTAGVIAYYVARKVWGHPWSGHPPEDWPTGRRP
jgi:hypothetical protein